MKHIIFLFRVLVLMFPVVVNAQADTALKRQLQGKQHLNEIMNTVKAYYKDPATINRLGAGNVERKLKKWARYEWYMSSRLGSNGEFVNINRKIFEATGSRGNQLSRMESVAGAWAPVGPNNTTNGIGRVDRLAFHPSNANIVYAGSTAGGLWRTMDAGTSWTNLTADIPSGGISGIVIDPVNPNTIYILTGDGDSDFGGLVSDFGYMRLSIGVLKSTDGGSNWSITGEFPGADYSSLVGYRLIMNPLNNNIIYACTNQGIYMTINGGDTWGLVNGGLSGSGERFFNMKFRPGSGNICYATSSNANFSQVHFWRSTTGGITWDTVSSVFSQINNPTARVELAVTPDAPANVYLLAGGVAPTGPFRFKGLLRSTDEGQSFTMLSNTPNILGRSTTGADNNEQSDYDLSLAVSNINSTQIIAGAVFVWHTPNSGNSWTNRPGIHGDIHDLGFHPVNNKLWAATDGGVYSSVDNGANWTSHFEGMNITQFYRMAVSPIDYLDMIGGSQDNAVKKRNNGTSTFDQIGCCDGFTVAYGLSSEDTIYAVMNRTINRSSDGGTNFTNITPQNTANPFAMSMAVHTSLPGGLFIGSDTIWRSINAGTNWLFSSSNSGGWFLRTCPSNGNRIYAAGGNAYNSTVGSLRRSDDGGVTWVGNLLSASPGFPNNFPKITSINVDPTNSNRVWVTFGGFEDGVKVAYSNDAGLNWVNRSGSLPNLPVNCIALDNNNNAYIGTDNGVYYRGASMNDWVPFYNNLPYVPVTELVISEAGNRIRAATFGRGIWSSDLYNNCPADMTVTGILEGQEYYEASNSINSTALLKTSAGTKVQMRGGNEVVLQDGFTARETTEFRALTGPCGSGGVAGFRLSNTDSSTQLSPRQFLAPMDGSRSLIHIHSTANNAIHFEINQKQNGVTDILLTDESGKIVDQNKFASSSAGKWQHTMSIPGLAKGLYYINVLLEGRVEHMQEVMIR